MKKIDIDLKYLLGLWIILFIAIIPTYSHHGDLIMDCGREVYYPTQVLLGKVLYKDIFNIYGPFAYMYNAILFKIFGIHLNVLYINGCLCSFAIVTLIYKISTNFFSKFLSFTLGLFAISTGVLNLNLFNYIFPYSYAVLYGIVAFLASIWFLLNYSKKPDSTIYLYLSSFFAGLCITSKYEFLLYLVVILYALFKIKSLKLKQYLFTVLSFLIVPIICFRILFIQGLNINELIATALTVKKIAECKTLEYFYNKQGVFFTSKTLPLLVSNFTTTIIPFALLIYGFAFNNKWISSISILLAATALFFWATPSSFVFIPVLITILALLDAKNLAKNNSLMILTLAGIVLSLKSYWGLATLNYGAYFVVFALITNLALFLDLLKNKNIDHRAIGICILMITFIFGFQNISNLQEKHYLLKTNRGSFHTYAKFYDSSNKLINYIKLNTKKSDKIVIYPEGAFINFLTDRESDSQYLSLIPLYIETFGDKKIIEHFKKHMPEYFIFNNRNTEEYGPEYICKDYAIPFCNFVIDNYKKQAVIDGEITYSIFKRK